MSHKQYKPFNPLSIGNTISCFTLARMLNDIKSNTLNRKVFSHINRFFAEVRRASLCIPAPDVRKYVGELILKDVKNTKIGIDCPENVANVIKNVKYAYTKDMLISDSPLNYSRKYKNNDGFMSAYDMLPELKYINVMDALD